MKTILLGTIAALAMTVSALAGDEVMASRFGNTTVITAANGATIKIWYNADHTWSGTMGQTQMSGTWKVDGGQLCVTNSAPPQGMPNPQCNPVVERKVGDSWTVGEGDRKMSATLVAGKQ